MTAQRHAESPRVRPCSISAPPFDNRMHSDLLAALEALQKL